MDALNNLPKTLLNLPFKVQLILAGLCVTLFLILYMILPVYVVTIASTANISIFAIPIALVAWMFKRYGVFISFGCIVLVVIVFHMIVDGKELWQFQAFLSFLIGLGASFIVGLLVSSLRDVIDLSEDARMQIAVIYEQQQHLNEIRDQFILNVNHELRTPLTAVYGYLELLRDYTGQLDAEMQAKFIENAMRSCEELQLLTNNILDTIQITNEKHHLRITELSVADLIYEVISSSDPRRLQEHPIHLEVPEHLVVLANDQYVRQVLRNLLSNAFKYAPVDTPITIKAGLHGTTVRIDHPSPEVYISVKDAGPGIPPEEIPRLFGQFVRLERDLSGKVRGTGLGLYVSKQLVEAMHGEIWVESSGVPGEGSCFRFTLPCVTRPSIEVKAKERFLPLENVHIVTNA